MSNNNSPVPQQERNPWVILVSVGLGLIMVIMDISILNIALPTLTENLHASTSEVEWTLIAYTLALTGLVPFFGRVSDVIGRKRLFISGIAVFALGSLLAAQSDSIGWLIGARLVQAFGGALITSNTLAIITDTFPAGQRGTAMGVQAIIVSGGAAIGPTLGGFLVTHFGWQSVFYINLPIAVVAVTMGSIILPPLQSHRTLEPLDWTGGIVLILGLGALLLAVTKAPEWGWSSQQVSSLLVAGVVLMGLFVLRELRTPYPLVDLRLFRIREFSAGQLAGVFVTLAMSALTFMFPFYWQSLRAISAEQTGIYMLPMPLTLMIVAPIAGRLSDTAGARVVASTGLSLIMVGLLFLSSLTRTTPVWDVVWRLVVFGSGMGLFLAPNNNAVMSSVPSTKRGIASGLLGMSRYTGQSLGIAFAGTIFANYLQVPGAHVDGLLPSPDTLSSLAGHPAAMHVFETTFMSGVHAITLGAIPFAGVGLVLSLLRGAHNPTSGGGPTLGVSSVESAQSVEVG